MQLSEDQFAEHLNDRLRMLSRSAEAYDQGDYAEATRLAGSIVKIIGDRKRKSGEPSKNFVSLSTHLGVKPASMVDTALHGAMEQTNLHGPLFILGFHVTGASGLAPLLDGFPQDNLPSPKLTPFDKWWGDPILRDGKGNEFSRQYIIETMRDKEDAHTDGELDSGYASISYRGAIGITQVNLNSHTFDSNPARVIARQVAHEVLRTFSPQIPPKWIQTRSLKVQPIMLYEIQEQDESGNYTAITDHKAIEFRSESTASPEVWQEWQKFIAPSAPIEEETTAGAIAKAKNFRVKAVFLNYAPYPIEGVQAMISMLHPVK
ncbi:hypothetical protein ACFQNF_10055 [Iodobacter arcticus]|uniref:Uncharacterized protein n=1 Tax=Iodobacter arcticus TaxID=590593 RepID=A0ABW2QWW7_9NEIS